MANTLQFVSDIASSPTVRLDLNDGTKWYLHSKPDFSPPPLKRSVVSTLLRDGAEIPTSAYDNRVLGITLTLKVADEDTIGTELQKLHRELDRERNILKWQSGNATSPVFFRCFRSPEYKLTVDPVTSLYDVDLQILAEPFAYGLEATPTYSGTIDNDPDAGGTNPCYIDVTGVLGDVPSPALITINPTTTISTEVTSIIGVRQHGTPGNVTSVAQAEAMTQGTDTSVQTTDAAMSGATNNYSQTTFATATMTTRLTTANFPSSGSGVDLRGVYRVFARLRRSGTTSTLTVRAATTNQTGDIITVPSTTNIHWLDLGLFAIPDGVADPIYDGYSLTEKAASATTMTFSAARSGGSDTLDWDAFFWVPADEAFCAVTHLPSATSLNTILDGPRDSVYIIITTGNQGIQAISTSRVGSILELVPNQTNRVLFILNAGTTTADDITKATTVDFSYWPRFLYIRP